MPNTKFIEIEKRWEEYFMVPAFNKAIEYLRNAGVIKSDSDIARKCNINKSLVSQYLSGDKPLPRSFITKFEHAFKINLQDVATYMDLSWVEKLIEDKEAPVHPEAYMASYVFFRCMIQARDLVIEGQRKAIEGMIQTNEMLMSVYVTQELKILNQVMDGTHYGRGLGKTGKQK